MSRNWSHSRKSGLCAQKNGGKNPSASWYSFDSQRYRRNSKRRGGATYRPETCLDGMLDVAAPDVFAVEFRLAAMSVADLDAVG